MKIFLLPIVAALSEDASNLLQTTKQHSKSQLEERANADGVSSGFESAIAGKKGQKDNVCDKEEAEALFKCFKVGELRLNELLNPPKDYDIKAKIAATARIFAGVTTFSNSSGLSDVNQAAADTVCNQFSADLRCMQANDCWKDQVSTLDHPAIKVACADGNNAMVPGLEDTPVSAACDQTPLTLCQLLLADDEVKDFNDLCARHVSGFEALQCQDNIMEFAQAKQAERCDEGTAQKPITTEALCKEAANVLGRRFHKLRKRMNRRPLGCYTHNFKRGAGFDTVYWNPATTRGRRTKTKNRPAVCVVE